MSPLVSILMPTLNAERTLALALEALRRQTIGRDAVEVLMADGGSTDRTREIGRRHGAVILENERVLPEYGVAVALAAARGRYALVMGSDEVITNEASLAIKVRLMSENPRVHNVIPGGLKNPRGYPYIGHYVNRCGDPFSYFMHRIDAGDHWRSLPRHYRVVREEPDYRVVEIGKDQPFPVCDGHFFSLEYLRSVADIHDHTVIAHLLTTMATEHRLLGVVKDDFIDHYSSAAYATARSKIEWRVIGNMHHADLGMAGYANREASQPRSFRWKKYLFLPYAMSIAAPAIDAAILAVRCRTPAMLYHLPLTLGTALAIVKHGAFKLLKRKPPQRAYGK